MAPRLLTMNHMRFHQVVVFVAALSSAQAALVVNPAQPITEQVTVNIIQVAADDGTNAAPLFGTADQQLAIFDNVDTIWAQAGIDIEFEFHTGTYNSSFALLGTQSPRPVSDITTIRSNAAAAGGMLDPDPTVLNLFMVRVVPGFSQTSNNVTNGLAFLGGNGITLWAGPNLPGFTGGQETIASVISHEIGHNLGLDHIVATENLMQTGNAANPGHRLNAEQIAAALGSSFSVPVPEPGTLSLAGLAMCLFTILRRKRGF